MNKDPIFRHFPVVVDAVMEVDGTSPRIYKSTTGIWTFDLTWIFLGTELHVLFLLFFSLVVNTTIGA